MCQNLIHAMAQKCPKFVPVAVVDDDAADGTQVTAEGASALDYSATSQN